MPEKYKNKYRTDSQRLQNWDYAWAGAYFITICTANREHYFGEIENGEMKLSHCGIVADILWHEIKSHATNIDLGAFVVMPNHIHGILIITNDNPETVQFPQYPQTSEPTIGQQRFQNQGKNTVSSIIGGYKSAVSKHLHRLNYEFAWQPRFYDHIIRNENAYQNISDYIVNNPARWNEDDFFINEQQS